ncbi:hypothetical protein K432DRAFT_385389 [Lepidopterella palustris CBS 459.81]|uniref:Uncharacterized protein n=1 Tax=Lepidopterella palustris CBS 459.81 TaxID=1314670 RepID=A0A8E2JBK5_9PEZI|nr:hypothetical protein K432DRAFT_385389 [Lepidopterella palustris CBS 459.81]
MASEKTSDPSALAGRLATKEAQPPTLKMQSLNMVDQNEDVVEDDDDDDDGDGEIEYLWKEVGSPFIKWLDDEITTFRKNKPSSPVFTRHQTLWQDFFSNLVQQLEANGSASHQLTTPPMPEVEIELLDSLHGRGCPCCLESDRPEEGRLFTLKEESGITKSVFLRLLRDKMYGEEDVKKYQYFQDVFEGGLVITGFNWMTGSPNGELWGVRPSKFPRLYFLCDGNRRASS